jgi:hypothetical protein
VQTELYRGMNDGQLQAPVFVRMLGKAGAGLEGRSDGCLSATLRPESQRRSELSICPPGRCRAEWRPQELDFSHPQHPSLESRQWAKGKGRDHGWPTATWLVKCPLCLSFLLSFAYPTFPPPQLLHLKLIS